MQDIYSGGLARAMSTIAGIDLSESTVESVGALLASLSLEVVPGTVAAEVTLRHRDQVLNAGSSALAKRLAELQNSVGEGPTLNAIGTGEPGVCCCTASDTPWPRWASQAHAEGIGSCLGVPLANGSDLVGAVTIYASGARRFDEEDAAALRAFVGPAAFVLSKMMELEDSRRLAEQLRVGMETRQIIGQATGILMEREGIDAGSAFSMLRRASQNANVKLRDIAAEIVRQVEGGIRS